MKIHALTGNSQHLETEFEETANLLVVHQLLPTYYRIVG